jgi:hypothetical protein
MILSASIKEIFIAQHAIDFRKGADSLIAECYAMELDPYRGECVVFVHRSRRALKIISGDAHGVWVLLRRFEGGALKEMFPFLENRSFVSLTSGELSLLLEGATCEVKAKAAPWKKIEQGDNSKRNVLPRPAYEQKVEVKKTEKSHSHRAAGGVSAGASLGQWP